MQGFFPAVFGVAVITSGILLVVMYRGQYDSQGLRTSLKIFAAILNIIAFGLAISIISSSDSGGYVIICGVMVTNVLTYIAYRAEGENAVKENQEAERFASLSGAERRAENNASLKNLISMKAGPIVPELICPHCQAKGKVHRKSGESGELYLSAGNTYRKKKETKMYCSNCETEWKI